MIVVGAPNSSNSQRLQEVAERAGCRYSVLVQRAAEIDWSMFDGIKTLGITAGASAPEVLVEEIIDAFAARYELDVETVSAADEWACSSRCRASFATTRPPDHSPARLTRRADASAGPAAWPSIPMSPPKISSRFLAGYDLGEAALLQGHRRGRREFQFSGPHRRRLFHPDALREARGGGRPAVLPRPDGASGSARHHLPAAGEEHASGEALGKLCGRPAAIVTFLDGMWMRRPNAKHCAAVGEALARLHLAGADFPGTARATRCRSTAGGRCSSRPTARADSVQHGLARDRSRRSSTHLEKIWPRDLPHGVIHADLFPDNVFFLGDKLSGLIDFYFACTDTLAYDVAICLNAWCFEPDHSYNVTKGRACSAPTSRCAPLSRGRAATRCRCSRAARRCGFC